MCISSGATPTSASAPTWPRSAAWRPATAAPTTSASACACRSSAGRPRRKRGELAAIGETIEPHLWTGITQVRPGAGIAVVGNPEQCAETLQNFIDLGCHSFCLSGYLHDEEAHRFGKWVMPILRERNRERMLAA
jgi:alkanesulfonate monooxygenase